MGTAKAVPADMFAYAEQTTLAEDQIRRWVQSTVVQDVEACRLSRPDIPDARYQAVTDVISVLAAVHDSDFFVGKVGRAFVDADFLRKVVPLSGMDSPLKVKPPYLPPDFLDGSVTLDDNQVDAQLDQAGENWSEQYLADLKKTAATSGDAVLRDEANRELLAMEKAKLEQELADAKAAGLPTADIQHKLDEINGIEQALADDPKHPGVKHYLLFFDTNGPNGHAAVSSGDPYAATTKNVTTEVSGLNSNLMGMSTDVGHADAVVDKANGLDGASDTAVVTWFGYDAPQLTKVPTNKDEFDKDIEVAFPKNAQDGAAALSQFQQQLVDLHHGAPATMSVIGHSYGSQVVAYAALQPGGLHAANVVFIGSPGVPIDAVKTLESQGVHVYAGERGGDPVPMIGHLTPFELAMAGVPDLAKPILGIVLDGRRPLGVDPCQQAGVQVFDAGNGSSGGGFFDPHNAYWDDGVSLDNLAAIVSGHRLKP